MEPLGTVFYLIPKNEDAEKIVDHPSNSNRTWPDPDHPSVPWLRIGLDQPHHNPPQIARFGRLSHNDVILPSNRFSRTDQCYFSFNKDSGELLLRDISEEGSTHLYLLPLGGGKHQDTCLLTELEKQPRQCVVLLGPDFCGKKQQRSLHSPTKTTQSRRSTELWNVSSLLPCESNLSRATQPATSPRLQSPGSSTTPVSEHFSSPTRTLRRSKPQGSGCWAAVDRARCTAWSITSPAKALHWPRRKLSACRPGIPGQRSNWRSSWFMPIYDGSLHELARLRRSPDDTHAIAHLTDSMLSQSSTPSTLFTRAAHPSFTRTSSRRISSTKTS